VFQRFPKPDSLGENGHYSANAMDDNKVRFFYKGEEKCAECHQDNI